MAEYLVARDIGVSHGVRRERLAHDLTTGDGIKVEVKSAAYVQGWTQSRPSQIVFDIRPTLGWDPDTAKFGETRRRQSDVYVFALLQEMDAQKLDPMNVKHWHFFVLATRALDQSCPLQKTISLQKLRALHPREVAFGAIANAISEATAMAKPRTEGPHTSGELMFDHVKFGVSDYAASKAFFLKALEPLGVAVVSEGPPTYGVELSPKGKASLCLYQTAEKPAHLHLAFTAENREQVEAFYRAALEAGGKDNGAPGLRPHYHANYYAAFVIGPDGHNIEVVCHEPEA